MKVNAVDLFCGAGGLTHGLGQAGVNINLGVDIDPACKYPYEANNEATFLLKSVEDISGDELKQYFTQSGHTLLAGCAPCQTFSTYNQKACPSDKRWWLLLQFARLVDETLPDLITMENVPGLVDQDVFKEFVERLRNNGYSTFYKVINSAEYGLPQGRKRLVLLASKYGDIRILNPDELQVDLKTVKDVIGDLPALKAGEVDCHDPLHQSSILSDLNLKRIRKSTPGGTWKDWPVKLRAACHQKESGKTYSGVYARMEWDKPAPTMTTQYYGFGNGRFGHPDQDRAISLREGAIFQGFPKDYKFVPPNEPIKKKNIARMVGNAVPVKLGEVIGKSIFAHLDQIKTSRCVVA